MMNVIKKNRKRFGKFFKKR